MMKAEYPWICELCKTLNMIDLESLDTKTLDKLVVEHGFFCEKCETWCVVTYSTESLQVAKRRLEAMDVKRSDFRFHFGKVMKKAEGVREKVEARMMIPLRGTYAE